MLCIRSSHGEFVFDRVQRQMLRDGTPVAAFDSVQSVDISSLPGREDARSWALSLYVSFFHRVTVGRTVDDDNGDILLEHWFPGVGPSEGLGIARDMFDRIFPVGYVTSSGTTQARITRIHG